MVYSRYYDMYYVLYIGIMYVAIYVKYVYSNIDSALLTVSVFPNGDLLISGLDLINDTPVRESDGYIDNSVTIFDTLIWDKYENNLLPGINRSQW
mgnify:CR=1 FL=1